MKKIISVLLAVVMMMSVFLVMSFAEENTQDICEHTTLYGQCSNCNAFIVEEGATLSLSIVITGYYLNPEWKLTENNATVTASSSDVLISFSGVAYQTEEWVEIKGVTVGADILKLYTSGSVYTSAEIVIVPHQTHIPKTIKGTATCTSPGLSDGEVCEYCGEVLTEQTEVDALGHQEEVIKGYAATCTETGLTDGVKCSLCDKIFTAQEEIPTSDHNYYMVGGEPSSCTVAVFQEYWCIDCGSTYIVTEEPTGHNYFENNFWSATCTESGWVEYYCWNCGDFYTETIEPTGHSYIEFETVAPTCTENGYIIYTCELCGDTYTGDEVPATGHTKTTVKGYAATCTKMGLTDGEKCSVCDETLTAQKEIPATGHTKETVKGYAATCTKAGLTDGVKCSVCGVILVAQEEIPILEMPDLTPNTENITVTDTVANLTPEMSVETFIASVENENVQILDKDGNELTKYALVGTGSKVNILDKDGSILSAYEVMVKSDVDGNGKVTPADARLALRAAAGIDTIAGVYETAANYDEKETISTSDARMILRKAAGLE